MQKHETNGQKLLYGQVWPCSVSKSAGNLFAAPRPVLSFPMLGSRNMSFVDVSPSSKMQRFLCYSQVWSLLLGRLGYMCHRAVLYHNIQLPYSMLHCSVISYLPVALWHVILQFSITPSNYYVTCYIAEFTIPSKCYVLFCMAVFYHTFQMLCNMLHSSFTSHLRRGLGW